MIQTLKNYLWHWPRAVFFSAWYGWPARKLVVVGVTGTKGKTTTAHMIYHILSHAPLCVAVGLISTLGAFFGEEEIDTGLHVTSPDPRELQRLLRMAVDRGISHMVLEVTSSGLDQFRVWGIKFKAAVITNIYPDHLDYHGTMEKYIAAKAKIVRQAETAVFPGSFAPVSSLAKFARSPSPTRPDLGSGLGVASDGSSLTRKFASFANLAGAKLIIVNFKEDASVTSINKELSTAAVKALGILETEAVRALKDFRGVKGRLEVVYRNKFIVVIDFAHTPESLAAALTELRKLVKKNGRLIAVFGCAGERDHGRRRMGEAAAKMADLFVITAEDPRTEKVEEISEEIAGYAKNVGAVEVFNKARPCRGKAGPLQTQFIRIPDRQEAITQALYYAKAGDVVGLFGKGHERSMAFGKEEMPWSEYEAVERALNYVRNIRIRRK